MNNLYIRNNFCEMWLQEGIIHNIYVKNLRIDLPIAQEITSERIRLAKGITRPSLIDVTQTTYMDMDAREYWSKGEGVKYMSASAFLVKNNMQRLMLNAFLLINRPAIPTKIFEDKEEALWWLNFFKHLN